MNTNYHTHTPHCGHAAGQSTAEYAESAFELGVEILGFSDHAAFPDKDFGCRMPYSEMEEYFGEVDALKKEYDRKGMLILKGVEIEYLPEYLDTPCIPGGNYYEYLLYEKKLDYLLCGEHFFRSRGNDFLHLYSIDRQDKIIEYAYACKEAMETGYFRMLAHPDLFGVNDFPWNEIYDRVTDIIIDAAVKTGTILELNANGFRRGIKKFADGERYQYPMLKFWEEVSRSEAKVIIGSDSHNPRELWDYAIPKARKYLHELNIIPIETI